MFFISMTRMIENEHGHCIQSLQHICFQATYKTNDRNEAEKLKKLREEWELMEMENIPPTEIVT